MNFKDLDVKLKYYVAVELQTKIYKELGEYKPFKDVYKLVDKSAMSQIIKDGDEFTKQFIYHYDVDKYVDDIFDDVSNKGL